MFINQQKCYVTNGPHIAMRHLLLLLAIFTFVQSFHVPCHHIARCNSPSKKLIASTMMQYNIKKRVSVSPVATMAALSSSGTVLVRSFFVRALASVYAISFFIALSQNNALIGDNGITPAKHVLDQAQERGALKRQRRLQWRADEDGNKSKIIISKAGWQRYIPNRPKPLKWISRLIDSNPTLLRIREICWDRSDRADRPLITLLWLANENRTDLNSWLDSIAVNGLALSVAMAVTGSANVPCMLAVWIFHRSLMSVGGPWYSFGWEPQLAELGFHALFCIPMWSLNPMHPVPIPAAVRWCIQWHLFRVMIGSGLIKLRSGDKKWKNLTAMNYFYETQPLPNPLTRYFHWMPPTWHKIEVLLNHFVELVAPWLLILPGLPTPLRRLGGIVQLIFQSTLILSGNLSFLNWLTMVPAIISLDDELLGYFLSPSKQVIARAAAASSWMHVTLTREIVSISFLGLVLWLSRPVVKNLLSSKQAMNRSYDPLRLINTYGAFGKVNEMRFEFIVSSACEWDGEWKEYEFKAKPGDVRRSPRFISPYHYRLDWQMWIAAAFGSIDHSPWMYNFLIKLLEQDQDVLHGLMAGDPWRDSMEAPKYIRVQKYLYKFHKPRPDEKDSPYWDRELIGNVYPKMGLATISSLKSLAEQ